jgi:NAD(P)-dependent dehydrogenase (short-subunit alcohol dehydrogenase family)
MNVNLDGKIAIVTGGAHGIGLAATKLLTACGATVVIADIDAETATRVVAEVKGTHFRSMDIAVDAEVTAGIDWIHKKFGRIDILVNNAGINTLAHRVTIDQFPIDEWDRIMDVDLRGQFLVSRPVAAIMSQQRSGRIINIASVLGVVPARLQCAFTAAKAGVVHLTRTMAIELANRGVLVNCIAPGSTITRSTESLFYGADAVMKDRADDVLRHIPLGRAGRAEEIAHGILFFAAPESSYVTGQTLCIDGGWTAGGFLRDF